MWLRLLLYAPTMLCFPNFLLLEREDRIRCFSLSLARRISFARLARSIFTMSMRSTIHAKMELGALVYGNSDGPTKKGMAALWYYGCVPLNARNAREYHLSLFNI